MKAIFADAFYYFALLNPDDEMHVAARDFTQSFTGTMLTTAWILTEVGDGLARVPNRPLFLRLLSDLRLDTEVMIVPPAADLFERGLELYEQRPDQEWSLTDCISFVVMGDEGMTDALTGDHHFEQAGFTAPLKPIS